MAFKGKVGRPVVGFPCHPHFVSMGKGFPVVSCMWVVIEGKDGSGGNCQELVMGHWEGGTGKFALRLSC